MEKEKQIGEMAKDLCNEIGVAVVIVRVRDDGTVCLAGSEKYLKNLVDKGYRKASDTAREIFAEIDIIIDKNTQWARRKNKPFGITGFNGRQIVRLIAELKKKYTESEKDE